MPKAKLRNKKALKKKVSKKVVKEIPKKKSAKEKSVEKPITKSKANVKPLVEKLPTPDKPIKNKTEKEAHRVPTHIPNFDSLIQGGFEKNSINVVVGGSGSGKSIFATPISHHIEEGKGSLSFCQFIFKQ